MVEIDPAVLMEAVPLPLVLIGADERVVAVNAPAAELFGRGLERRHYIAALRSPTVLDCVEPLFLGQKTRSEGVYLASKSGKDTTWRVIAARLDAGTRSGVLVSFEDTTAVQEAGQIRRDFVANVSHELRTPLTALLGFIETLRGAARHDRAAQDRFLAIMEREAGRMNRLVRDLLSLSRVESEERMRPTDPVNIAGVLRSVVLTLKPVADAARVRLEIDGAEAPRMVPGDQDQLLQVFSNLVENGIKYSGAGSTVRLSLGEPAYEPSVRAEAVRISVADDGDGIDPVHLPRLTERFYRVDSHRSREMGGTGLGLAIVKHIVNRHRGRLRIESTPGQGAEFTVILPTA